MKEDGVLYSSENGIAKIILNRPQSLNAFNREVLKGIGEAFDNARLDQKVKVAILTGQGGSFSAGGDLGDMERLSKAPPMEAYLFMLEVNEVVKKVIQFPKPLLTAINGAAMGGGCSLALAGDVVIASEKATFGFVFSRFNLIMDTGSSFILPRLVGTIRAKDLIFSGRIFSAKEAKEYGLISEVVQAEIFDETVMARAHQMSEWSQEAVSLNKWILGKAKAGCDLETLLELEAKTQAILFSSADTQKKINAFLEKKRAERTSKADR